MFKQKGFTLPELIFLIVFIVVGGIGLGLVITAFHFIAKFW